MAEYLLIESRDPFEARDADYFYGLAEGLVREGNKVTLFLAQNGVLAARPSKAGERLSALGKAGVEVLADEFSLAERGIGKLAQGVAAAPIGKVVDLLAAGRKTLWH